MKLKKIPIISTFLHYDKFLSTIDHLTLPFYHRLEKRQFNHHKNVITISNSSKNDIIKHYGIKEEHIKVYPVGIDTNRFRTDINAGDLKDKLRWNNSHQIVICTRTHKPVYGIEYLIKAIPLIIQKNPSARFLFIGEGPLTRNLKQIVSNLRIKKYVKLLTNLLIFLQ